MQRKSIHIALFFFFLTAFTGVWMRFNLFTNETMFIPYTHLLHAHSHIAVLGWTFFAVFIIFIALMNAQRQKYVTIVTTLLFVITTAMFFAFLMQGYALYSIILSTLHIFLEYAVAYFIIITVRKNKHIPNSSRLFMYGSVVMLIISSIGPFALGGIASQGLRDSPIFEMAIYFYLHFQYNGWLYLMLIGMFLFMLHRRNINYSEKMMTYSFWFYFIALFPSFFLSILWYGFGILGVVLATIGAIGQLVGVTLFIVTMIRTNNRLHKTFSHIIHYHIYGVLFLLALKSLMELGLINPSFGEVIYETRSVVIAYLHLTLLGFISVFILTQFYLTNLLDITHSFVKTGLYIFIIGFALNELVLFFAALFAWLNLGTFPGQNIILLFASICLLVAIMLMWGSTLFKDKKMS